MRWEQGRWGDGCNTGKAFQAVSAKEGAWSARRVCVRERWRDGERRGETERGRGGEARVAGLGSVLVKEVRLEGGGEAGEGAEAGGRDTSVWNLRMASVTYGVNFCS